MTKMPAHFDLTSNLVPRVFSLAWGRGGKSQGKDPGNEVV